jgi:hypothetical protein
MIFKFVNATKRQGRQRGLLFTQGYDHLSWLLDFPNCGYLASKDIALPPVGGAGSASMPALLPTPEHGGRTTNMSPAALPPPAQTSRPQRVLACVLCQQCKVKCDRKFPCTNCVRSRAQCVPATLATRRRRRKFPERELLERLRTYEDLLRQNNIKFNPLFKDSTTGDKGLLTAEGGYDSEDEHPEVTEADWPSPATASKFDRVYEAKYEFS